MENTAISNGVSKSIRGFGQYIKGHVLDYGAGRLRNAKYLVENNYKVSVLDVPSQVEKWGRTDRDLFENILTKIDSETIYDTILLTFVLNVIPSIRERTLILREIKNSLSIKGNVIIEVRRDKSILKSKYIEEYKDGYILGKGKVKTFQKPFTKEEIIKFVSQYFSIIETKKESDSIIIIGGHKK